MQQGTLHNHIKKNVSFVGNTRILPNHLVNMNEHHKGIAFTRGILFLFQERMNQLWCIRNEEVKVSGGEKYDIIMMMSMRMIKKINSRRRQRREEKEYCLTNNNYYR